MLGDTFEASPSPSPPRPSPNGLSRLANNITTDIPQSPPHFDDQHRRQAEFEQRLSESISPERRPQSTLQKSTTEPVLEASLATVLAYERAVMHVMRCALENASSEHTAILSNVQQQLTNITAVLLTSGVSAELPAIDEILQVGRAICGYMTI